MASIGGVEVSDGGTVYWAKLASVLIAVPASAWYLGAVRTLRRWTGGVLDAIQGAETTAWRAVTSLVAGPTAAFNTAEDTFVRSISGFSETTVTVPSGVARLFPGATPSSTPVQLSLGPFTFAFGVFIASLSAYAFYKGLTLARGGLGGR